MSAQQNEWEEKQHIPKVMIVKYQNPGNRKSKSFQIIKG